MEVERQNAEFLKEEIAWMQALIDQSLSSYFKNEPSKKRKTKPQVVKGDTPYEKLIKELELNEEERVVLMLAVMMELKPQSLDIFLIKNKNLDCDYVEFGGVKDANKKGFSPTLETACFILNGSDINGRMQFLRKFNKTHVLFKKGILNVDSSQEYDIGIKLKLSNEFLGYILNGKKQLPHLSSKFPAREISTDLDWSDLVVNKHVENSLMELRDWLVHHETILIKWKLGRFIKPGYRALFHGPSGTGKTLAATLLGKAVSRPVFRVDLSMVVSKYIGETEKNLSQLFDEAENKEWILFFDEADALFGKRTQTKDAHDRYANQEVSYLLQRIEDFSGLVILATNMQGNVDEAFNRRFQSVIRFAKPDKKERLKLWRGLLSDIFELDPQLDLEKVAEDYELTGGEMVNVLSYCALQAARRKEKLVLRNDLIYGIRREYTKSNKTL